MWQGPIRRKARRIVLPPLPSPHPFDAIELLEEVNEEKIAMMAENADDDASSLGRSMVDRLLARGDTS